MGRMAVKYIFMMQYVNSLEVWAAACPNGRDMVEFMARFVQVRNRGTPCNYAFKMASNSYIVNLLVSI